MGLAIELFVRELPPLQRFLTDALGYRIETAEGDFVAVRRGGASVYLRRGFEGLGGEHPFADAVGQRLGLGVEIILDAADLEHARAIAAVMGFAPTPITAAPWGGADFRLTTPEGFYLRIRGGP